MGNKFSKTKSGFSIVELLTVLAIMSIMMAILLIRQNTNKAQTDVEVAARQVAAQLRQLQNEALNGKQIGEVSACKFNFNANGTAVYSVSYNNCTDGALLGSVQSINVNSKKNVTAGAINVSFSSPLGKLSDGITKQIILTSSFDSDSAKKSSVCVCSSGNITEKKDATACGC